MKKCEIDTAIRRALNMFDEWNDCTGFFDEHSSYHSEMQSIIEDAVHCGIQQALKDFHKIGDYEFENVRYSVQQPISEIAKIAKTFDEWALEYAPRNREECKDAWNAAIANQTRSLR